jgi:predicted nucleic acid-binding Zn ribbon protein
VAHLIDMDEPARTCKLCGNPFPPKKGKGRPRIYCSDHCRNLAYTERLEERFDREPVEPSQPVPGSVLDRWVTEGAKFDDIVQDPYLLGRFMDDLMCRIAVDHILENHHYQHAVNQLIVTFFMIGRMSDGTFQLPIVV